MTLGVKIPDYKLKQMAGSLCRNLEEEKNVEENVEKWFGLCSQFQKIQTSFLYYLYHMQQEHVTYGEEMAEYCLFPICRGVPQQYQHIFPSVLTIPDVLFLNTFLPPAMQQQWRFCFSTAVHGESFAKLLGLIVDKGPSVIVVKDKSNHVFGGYASENWTVGPNFKGKHHMNIGYSTGCAVNPTFYVPMFKAFCNVRTNFDDPVSVVSLTFPLPLVKIHCSQ